MKRLLDILSSAFVAVLLFSCLCCEKPLSVNVDIFDTLNVKVPSGVTLEVALGFSDYGGRVIISGEAENSKHSMILLKQITRERQPIFYEYASLDDFTGKDSVYIRSGWIGDEESADTVHHVWVNFLVE